MGNGYSVSATRGRCAPEHDRREYIPGNVDKRLSVNNRIVVDTPNEREAFNELFAESIDRYNLTQKRKDRHKSYDYLSTIENSNHAEKPFYEYVFQIGNCVTNGVTTEEFNSDMYKVWTKDKDNFDIGKYMNHDPDRLKLKKVLDSEMDKLQERYPNFHFWSIIGHDDEPGGTYHYQVRFTPVGTGYKDSMDTRCSLTRALNLMGFKTNGGELAIKQWQNDVKDRIAEAMEREGYHREFMSNKDRHVSVSTYKMMQEKEALDAEIQALSGELEDVQEELETENDRKERLKNTNSKFLADNIRLTKENAKLRTDNESIQNATNERKAFIMSLPPVHADNDLSREQYMKRLTIKGISLDERYHQWLDNENQNRQEAKNRITADQLVKNVAHGIGFDAPKRPDDRQYGS